MEEAHSPIMTLKSKIQMDFPTAIKKVIIGKKITKLEWASNDEYAYLKDSYLMIHHKGDERKYQWIISEGDLLGNDYIVLGEAN